MSQLVIIAVSDVRTAKDSRQYFITTFRPGFGQRAVKRTMWQQFVRDSETQELTSAKYWERATPEEAQKLLKSGEPIEGEKVTAKVEKYMLGENEVDTYSTVIFPDENAERVFANNKHPMVDTESGELITFKRKAVLSAKKEEDPAMAGK